MIFLNLFLLQKIPGGGESVRISDCGCIPVYTACGVYMWTSEGIPSPSPSRPNLPTAHKNILFWDFPVVIPEGLCITRANWIGCRLHRLKLHATGDPTSITNKFNIDAREISPSTRTPQQSTTVCLAVRYSWSLGCKSPSAPRRTGAF